MDQTILGVIDATEYKSALADLTQNRSIAAIPFAGRYRLVDFILSSMVNSGILSVAIFPKYQYRSLMDHVGSGKYWDLNRKKDGLFFFPSPDVQYQIDERNSFQQYEDHLDYFLKSTQKYVLIANGYTVCNIDFGKVLKNHIHSGCDITEVYHYGQSIGMVICEKSLLLKLIKTRSYTGYKSMADVTDDLSSDLIVNRYDYKGYVAVIDSIERYYKHNLALIHPQNWKRLFVSDTPIYSKVKDEPPTKYTDTAYVKNSIIANGCIIEGHVENSILFRTVKIGKDAIIKNSIIMQNGQIGINSLIENAILDKNVIVEDDVELYGTEDCPFVIQKGKVQGALMNT